MILYKKYSLLIFLYNILVMDSKTGQKWETFDDPLDKLQDKKWPQTTNKNTSLNDNLFNSVSNSTSMSSGVDSLDFGQSSKTFVTFDGESVGSTSNSSENSVKIKFDIPEENDDKYAIFSKVDKVDGAKGWGRSVLGVGPMGWSNNVLGVNEEEINNLEKTKQKSQHALKIGDDSVKAWFNNLK